MAKQDLISQAQNVGHVLKLRFIGRGFVGLSKRASDTWRPVCSCNWSGSNGSKVEALVGARDHARDVVNHAAR